MAQSGFHTPATPHISVLLNCRFFPVVVQSARESRPEQITNYDSKDNKKTSTTQSFMLLKKHETLSCRSFLNLWNHNLYLCAMIVRGCMDEKEYIYRDGKHDEVWNRPLCQCVLLIIVIVKFFYSVFQKQYPQPNRQRQSPNN